MLMRQLRWPGVVCFVRSIAIACLAVATSGVDTCAAASASEDRPNIVLIVADDLGYGDVGCFVGEAGVTPRLNSIAERGARLTSFYSDAPVCSPTRASLLTGRYPQRHGLTNVIEARADDHRHLSIDQPLFVQSLQAAGYRTALCGKWHLGAAAEIRPHRRGFDEFVGGLHGGLDFFTHETIAHGHDLWRNDEPYVRDGDYVTDLTASEGIQFIESAGSEPFFLMLSFHAPHTSMGPQTRGNVQAPARWLRQLSVPPSSANSQRMAACLAALDEAVGEVVDAIARSGRAERTLIVFTSDNGPVTEAGGSAGPFRGSKHSLWEGGVRVPTIVVWPRRIPPGSTYSQPAISHDVAPTILSAAGVEYEADVFDGDNLLPFLEQSAQPDERTLYWSYLRQAPLTRERAVRRGNWKWLNGELYDLSADPGENRDVASAYSSIAQELAQSWSAWIEKFPVEKARWGDQQPVRTPLGQGRKDKS
ncbi:sulfatase-like hydrolase/transferase [Lacipirellula sp.]|uniref:sulfatase-like hydrolase/transferase n=1 Tax=Lacipirellula sp. TaxID=2691419 RepID=UPI003D0B9A89